MKQLLSILITLTMIVSLLAGCTTATVNEEPTTAILTTDAPEESSNTPEESTSDTTTATETTTASPSVTPPEETTTEEPTTKEPEKEEPPLPDPIPCTLNGVSITEYTIVYPYSTGPDYNQNAATYLSDEIAKRTGNILPVKSDRDQAEALAHEIVVGETNRAISATLDADTADLQFALLADDAHIAMEGDYFVIAAAAYYFVETYVKTESFDAVIEKEATIHDPIVKEAKNYIFLIGDGMGFNQTKIFDVLSASEIGMYSDGEDAFYGYMLPYAGSSRTDSLSGTTDSAAGGTALATGYKTKNGYIGMDSGKNEIKSLTEIAASLGKATAVMSTEVISGATPASFSAHEPSRDNTEQIRADQKALTAAVGTLYGGDYGSHYTEGSIRFRVKRHLRDTLEELSENENGFFIMYEEAYIDKHCHSNDLEDTFRATLRFNQIIACFMEYAFYHPETALIITADHETGGLTVGEDGAFSYTSTAHTSADVPVFAYGYGMEMFDGITMENIQIPKTLAKMWGYDLIGYDNENYPALG